MPYVRFGADTWLPRTNPPKRRVSFMGEIVRRIDRLFDEGFC